MPELAEVCFYLGRWRTGFGGRVVAAEGSFGRRIFRGVEAGQWEAALLGRVLTGGEARGKQLLFAFEGGVWLGLHMGMTGALRLRGPGHSRGKHEHLVLRQEARALVFDDPRLFGRARLDLGPEPPAWWVSQPPEIQSSAYTEAFFHEFLARHSRLSLKALLLRQEGFPGIGNWMADEALWRSGLHPGRRVAGLGAGEGMLLLRELRLLCAEALAAIGAGDAEEFGDPPPGWLFHERWRPGGSCPRDGVGLARAAVGGRTTAWCPRCQPEGR